MESTVDGNGGGTKTGGIGRRLPAWVQSVLMTVTRPFASQEWPALAGLLGVLLLFYSVGCLHALGVPHLMPYDEPAHAAYALHVAKAELPTVDSPLPSRALHASNRKINTIWVANHPPLYYWLVSYPIAAGVANQSPETGVRWARLITLLIACGGLAHVYLLVREVFPERPALAVGASALAAGVPSFVHIMALVHNDALAFLGATASLYAGVLVLRRGPSRRRLALAAWWFSCALLTRFSALFAIVPAFLMIFVGVLLHTSAQPYWKRLLRAAAACLAISVVAAAASGWFFARSYRLYGDLTGARVLLEKFARTAIAPAIELAQRPRLWLRLYDESWSRFAGGIRVDQLLPDVARWLFVLGALGVTYAAVRRRREWLQPERLAVLGALLLALTFHFWGIFEFHSRGGSAHARYLFPVLWMFAFFIALGLSTVRSSLPLLAAVVLTVLVQLLSAMRVLGQLASVRSPKALDLLAALKKAAVPHHEGLLVVLLLAMALGLAAILRSITLTYQDV